MAKRTPEERFWSKVDRGADDECWLWTGSRGNGYGHFFPSPGKGVRAHRYAYELLVGPIPEGLVLDHLCRNPPCVNPAHLEPVTNRENVLRGVGVTAMLARQTHCKNGHEFTPENTRVDRDGSRVCLTCKRASNAVAWQKWRSKQPRRTPSTRIPRIQPDDGDPRHGTQNGYGNLGCRCDACTAAHWEYQRPYNARVRYQYEAQGLTMRGTKRKQRAAGEAR